jgi:predicted metalloprotease with PDZ domain
MNYKITIEDPNSKYIAIEATLYHNNNKEIEVQLPAWRPGRYELQNFAKNIQTFEAFTRDGILLQTKKITKDRWLVDAQGNSEVVLKYRYYADQTDAGGSYVDKSLLYVNPINCCVYVEGRIDEKCTVAVEGIEKQELAGGMRSTFVNGFHHFDADDFCHLTDLPFLLSAKLQHEVYEVNDVSFHIWVAGHCEIPWNEVLSDFQKFTQTQFDVFGEFPEPDYHFVLWVLPTAYYHGVEHRNSTMMVLGPDTQPFDEVYGDLLGLASHELFHAWNVCKIRPVELIPYNYTKENYFETCFVAEGITTFYGDWMLYRSGVFDENQYNKELETCYRRHFETAGEATQSLTESSFDLWLDGYTRSVPNRKVSVYHKGAIAAQILQFQLEKVGKSLDDVMQLMWERFGKPFTGYTFEDYKTCCEEIIGYDLSDYFEKCITGTESLWEDINDVLHPRNLTLNKQQDGRVTLEVLT